MANTPITPVRIPLDIRELVEAEADKEGRTVSNMVIRLLMEALAARKRRK